MIALVKGIGHMIADVVYVINERLGFHDTFGLTFKGMIVWTMIITAPFAALIFWAYSAQAQACTEAGGELIKTGSTPIVTTINGVTTVSQIPEYTCFAQGVVIHT